MGRPLRRRLGVPWGLLPAALVLPCFLAALGWWTPLGAAEQGWVMDRLLALTLRLESLHFSQGPLGTWQIPAAMAIAGVITASATLWEPRLPRPLRAIVIAPEIVAVALGALGAAGLGAVGVAVDRGFFCAGALILLLSWRERPPEAPWSSPSNLPWRLAVVLASLGVAVYGAASLLEGATYTNPALRIAGRWVDGPGRSPWTSGGLWLGLGALGALPGLALRRWIRQRRRTSATPPAAWSRPRTVALIAAVPAAVGLSALDAGAPHVALARALSAGGLVALLLVWAPLLAPPRAPGLLALDPRRLARSGVPWLLWAGLCTLRGLSVSLWTVPTTLPPGVERLSDERCVFSLRSAGDATWFTDRCAVALGRIDEHGEQRTWDLHEQGATQVEELGGPSAGTLFAAVAAWTDEAQLVLLAIDPEDGPRSAREPYRPGPDAPYVPLPSCWASAWIPLPDGQVLLGCENTSEAHVLDPAARSIVRRVDLGTRLEAGSFDPDRQRLFGVALWDDTRVHAWAWPQGEPLAERVVGPFNWSALFVPSDGALWVSRFLEGSILRLDPTDLHTLGVVPLSFGIRALEDDPRHGIVWAAAAYTGRLWAISARDPRIRRSLSLCGQARDLSTDREGRLLVGTDCGLFRVDPTVAFAGVAGLIEPP